MLRHRKKHSNALNHMNSFQHLKENGENNSSINNSASDMSDDESSTLAMINNKKLMEMSQHDASKPTQDMMNQVMSRLGGELMRKFMTMQPQGGSNLLENLLGMSGQSINHLMSSPDEAAKLLRVEK